MILYDRMLKRIILGEEELHIKGRFVSLRAMEAAVLKEFLKETSGVKKRLTEVDILTLKRNILRKLDPKLIREILEILVKKGILEYEKITIQGQIVDVFKIKI
ncbi:hypothetical protein ES702_07803 [subsurface metagenome]